MVEQEVEKEDEKEDEKEVKVKISRKKVENNSKAESWTEYKSIIVGGLLVLVQIGAFISSRSRETSVEQ